MDRDREILFYTRGGCSLCEEALAHLEPIARRLRLAVRQVDIDACAPEVYYRHRYRIPVIEHRGVEIGWGRIDVREVERRLEDLAR